MDLPEDVKDGSVPGVKNAAVRKLNHELGISAEDVPVDAFKFLTRIHYYAADAVTHGPNSPWGEHEIDYILFIKVSCHVPGAYDSMVHTCHAPDGTMTRDIWYQAPPCSLPVCFFSGFQHSTTYYVICVLCCSNGLPTIGCAAIVYL